MAFVMPKAFVEEFKALPLRTANSKILYLAFEDRLDASLALALQKMSGLKVVSGFLDSEELRTARQSLLAAGEVIATVELILDIDLLTSKISEILEEKQPVYTQLVRVHHYLWLRLWLESGAASGVGTLPRSQEDMADYVFRLDSVSRTSN
jgi:hypothetical protein